MPGRPYVLSETNWKTVKETEYNVAILPWGATEAHNYHLPYGTDSFQSEYIAIESARLAWQKGAKVIVLPIIPYGVNTGQIDIKLTMNMNPSTQTMIIEDMVDSLSHQGIQKLLILNGHGGNDFKHIIRELSLKYPDFLMATLDWYKILDEKKFFENQSEHGGEMETSNILFINSDLVLSPEEAGSGAAKNYNLKAVKEGWVWMQRDWLKVTNDTGIGNPELASVEKGQKYIENLTHKISEFLFEFSTADKDKMYE